MIKDYKKPKKFLADARKLARKNLRSKKRK
jgi:hypothetical protein